MTPVVRACCNPKYSRVVVVCGSQMAKTEALFNVIGHRLEDDPAPILYIGPTQKLVESYSEGRVMPMLRSAPALWERLHKGKKNKITEKFISGVRLGFGWSGSATELAGHPAALVLVDERDRMEDVKGEGDPVSLAEARVATYPDGRVIVASTPTVGHGSSAINEETGLDHWEYIDTETDEGKQVLPSPIWRLWQKGTRHEWAWPCPECEEYFIPRFKLLKWPDGATPDQALSETRMACPHCGALIDDIEKQQMNARGVYVAPGQRVDKAGTVTGNAPESRTASFWVSGLCSPWRTFGERAAQFLDAVRSGNRAETQVALNTGIGELYHIGGDGPDWQDVANKREGYVSGILPEGVQVLTCAVDVQKNRLVYAVRGWGWNFESWLVDHGELWGETEHDAVWTELHDLLTREVDGKPIRLMLIDSGYRPGEKDRNPDNQIYQFCRQHRGRAFPTKGHDTQDKPYKASKIDVSWRGKIIKNGLDLWHIDTDYMKSWVHARIEWPTGEPGGWHIPADATDDYCQQLVAEHRAVNPSGKVTWLRIRRDNHYLDVEALNVAAAHILRLHMLPKPADSRAKPAEPAVQKPVDPPESAPISRPIPRARRNWVTGFRNF
jgi:phage terminase large subunit GpA-like protein